MNQLKLVTRNIKHYFRSHLWVALGVALTTAVLTGGLIVGDSVKHSLKQATELRLGNITHAVTSGDRYFTQELSSRLNSNNLNTAAALKIEGIASTNGGQLSLNKVNVWGIDNHFVKTSGLDGNIVDQEGTVSISQNMAARLNVSAGDDLLLILEKATLIPANAPFVSDEELTVSYRTRVGKIVPDDKMGRLYLQNSQTAPFNIFIPINTLNELMEMEGKANVLLISTSSSEKSIRESIQAEFTLKDASLQLTEIAATGEWELSSERVFMDENIGKLITNTGIDNIPVLTYFTNYFKSNNGKTPYSFISTVSDEKLSGDEIIINSWLADDLNVNAGDSIEIGYYNIGALRQLEDASAQFVIKEIVPISGYFSDQKLMPDIPGLSDSESCRDWQTGVPVDLKSIRDKDEEYWYDYRGLPKAFVSVSTAQELWSNRFGNATAYRFNQDDISSEELMQVLSSQLEPFELDFQLRNVKAEGISAAENGTDFTQLFIGLSFFIIAAGIILTALLFRFSLEKRTAEIGTYAALGFSNKKVQAIFLHEGIMVARAGAFLGIFLAIGYNKLVFWGLNQVWYDIVRTQVLVPEIKIVTLLIGFLISLLIAMITIWLTVRKKLKQQTASLQRKAVNRLSKTWRIVIKIAAGLSTAAGIGIALTAWIKSSGNQNSGAFFLAGGLLLFGLMLFAYIFLNHTTAVKQGFGKTELMIRNLRYNKTQSFTIILLLAIGTYLVVSTGLNRKDLFSTSNQPSSGTGGFLFWTETTLPILHDLNNPAYRSEQGFSTDFEAVQMRIAEGDDASCLNLNRISNPRILGIPSEKLLGRFSVQAAISGVDATNIWSELQKEYDNCIPAIADQTILQWSLGKKVGDTLVYQNALGEEINLLLIAGLKSSVFQGNVMIDNRNFLDNFPTSSGTQVFLINGYEEDQQMIADDLNLIYRDFGIQITPAATRLAEFMSVTNTYLSIFLVLGALGLLIGTIGLAIILQRSLLDRKAEFALMKAVGFKQNSIFSLVVAEYSILLISGILVGFVTSILSVLPSIKENLADLSTGFVTMLFAIILVNGLIWITVLAWVQLRKMKLVESLRND